MYNPINNVAINTFMRWPLAILPAGIIAGISTQSIIVAIIAWIASVAAATYASTKVFKDKICDCEEELRRKGLGSLKPSISWVIEYNSESGTARPWELYSMFGDDEHTKQHYASYATESNALKRKAILENMIDDKED